MRARATYINAGLRGSRFIGDCEVIASDGIVRLSGHRMSMAHSWIRSICYVLFVPRVLIAFSTFGFVAAGENGWPYAVAVTAGMFLLIAVGLGGVDIWNTYRGPEEAVSWRSVEGVRLQRTYDQTASLGGTGTTLVYRHALERCVVKLRAPIGPNGKLRLVALRSEPQQVGVLEWILSGAPRLDD
jgi:hypothetical protein